jgi:phage terminase large subunit GpA-like protein
MTASRSRQPKSAEERPKDRSQEGNGRADGDVGAPRGGPADQTKALGRECCRLVAPPPKLTVSGWADERRVLPRSSAEPGRWRTSRTPYLRAPMDACCDPETNRVVMIFASQLGKSETGLNITGYYMDYDPAPVLMVQPTVETAEAFSKERLAPMLSETPSLAGRVSDPKSRDAKNTILRKEFPGGYLVLVGANAPAGLASRAIRLVVADEIDRFPLSAGSEGDPLSLAEKRQTTFWNALTVVMSTPTVKGISRIESEYENSTQEQWLIPCPSCGFGQPYEWPRLKFPDGPTRTSAIPGKEKADGDVGAPRGGAPRVEAVELPMMACIKCGCLHSEYEWKAGEGEWFARKEHPTTRGFRLNAMASPWMSWAKLIAEFLDAKEKGPEVLKTFINTRLAECWEEPGESIEADALSSHQHYYNCDVPAGVRILTAGVDVQGDRLELEVVGWGRGEESWGIEYRMLPGDPHKAEVWNDLDQLLERTYERSDGALLPISCAAIDSGYATSSVYAYTKKRAARYIFAIKGQGGPGRPVVGAWSRQGKNKDTAVFPVGTDSSKDLLLTRLSIDAEGPGFCHFPAETTSKGGDWPRGYNKDYFKGLSAEHRVERRIAGQRYHVWVKRYYGRNEPLDCRVYATAALKIRNPDLGQEYGVAAGQAPAKSRATGRRVVNRGIE